MNRQFDSLSSLIIDHFSYWYVQEDLSTINCVKTSRLFFSIIHQVIFSENHFQSLIKGSSSVADGSVWTGSRFLEIFNYVHFLSELMNVKRRVIVYDMQSKYVDKHPVKTEIVIICNNLLYLFPSTKSSRLQACHPHRTFHLTCFEQGEGLILTTTLRQQF